MNMTNRHQSAVVGMLVGTATYASNTSVNTLLTHTVAHSTMHSFRHITNNHFKSFGQLSKSHQILEVILENKVV